VQGKLGLHLVRRMVQRAAALPDLPTGALLQLLASIAAPAAPTGADDSRATLATDAAAAAPPAAVVSPAAGNQKAKAGGGAPGAAANPEVDVVLSALARLDNTAQVQHGWVGG
jgi:hypothetical protein